MAENDFFHLSEIINKKIQENSIQQAELVDMKL